MLRQVLRFLLKGVPSVVTPDTWTFAQDGCRATLQILECDQAAHISGILRLSINWSNSGPATAPGVRVFLVWSFAGDDDCAKTIAQPMAEFPTLTSGAERQAETRLGIPLDRAAVVDIGFRIENDRGAAWDVAGSVPIRRLPVTEATDAPDFDYVDAYRSADLNRNWWSIVGPSSREEHEALARSKLRHLQELGLHSTSRILDVGCGTGALAEQLLPILSPAGLYIGTDIAPEAIAFCIRRFSRSNIRFLQSDRSRIPIDELEFDIVYFGSVFPHLYPTELRAMLSEARRLLAAGGQIIADAFVSATIPAHAGDHGMVQVSETLLQAMFDELGLRWDEIGSAPWSADCRRVEYRLTWAVAPQVQAGAGSRDAVLVLGMHRSGTSIVTRLLAAMGAAAPADLDPSRPDNPDGYWEPSGVVREMEMLLAAADSAWFDWRPLDRDSLMAEDKASYRQAIADAIRTSFGTASRSVLKDPRACRTPWLFRELLEQGGAALRVVLVLRDPGQVAASLRRRDLISSAYAGLVWARHMLAAEAGTRDMPRLLIDYDALLASPDVEIARIKAFLPWPANVDPESVRVLLRTTPGSTSRRSEIDPELDAALMGLHAALARIAKRDDSESRAAVDAVAKEIDAIARRRSPALEAEFAFLRATGRHMQPGIARPPGDVDAFAAAMGRLHDSLAAQAAGPPARVAQPTASALRGLLFRDEALFDRVVPNPATVDMQGWNSDHPILGWCIGTLRPRLVIEVGTWKGRSAMAMARAMDEHGVEGEILCVDTWLGSPEHWLATGRRQPWRDSLQLRHGYPRLYDTFLNNVVVAGLQHRITPLPLPSDAAFLVLREHAVAAQMIHIDAGHDEESVSRDLRLYLQLLAPGGAMVMDDYGDRWPGVRMAVDRFQRDNGLVLQAGGGKALLSRQPGLHAPPCVMSG